MLKALKNLLGTKSDRDIKAIMPFVKSVQAVYDSISQLSNDELRAKTPEFKERIADYIADEENEIKEIRAQIEANPDMDINEQEKLFKTIDQLKKKSYEKSQEVLNDILPEAFSLVRESAIRTLGQRHYDVQIIGGIALHKGKIAEMKTGEGKTLVSTLSAYLNALSGKGVHIVTVNDYLAKRDCLEMGKIYNFLGVSSGFINNHQNDTERKKKL